MTSIRPLVALTLPAILAAGCAAGTSTEAAPEKKAPVVIDQEADGRDVYENEVPEPSDIQTESKDSTKTTTGAPSAAGSSDPSEAADPAARPAGTSGGRIVYNMKPPKGFKRYNAPGAYNVNKLIYPRREVFGVFTDQARNQIADRNALGKKVGMKPNMIKSFFNWGNGFDPNWAKRLWAAGAIPQYELEMQNPEEVTLADVANGQEDEFIRAMARNIRRANVPVVFSPWHEFNGDWYPWGFCGATSKPESNACKVGNSPADFKGAWKRMHGIFKQEGATNAIWLWQANQIGARPKVGLKQFYPGNSYVDWVGVVGYYYHQNNWYHTFDSLFMPTIKQLKTFTKKPIFIPEMGMEPGPWRAADIKDFLYGVAKRSDVVGFLWFSYNKPTEMDFRIDSSASSTKAFKTYIHKAAFGFNPKTLKK